MPKIEIKKVGNLNWLKKVASDFPPLTIARWTIYGGAHKKKVKGNPLALQIDATSAFGTGEHPTTQGCLKMLDWYLKNSRHPGRNEAKRSADPGPSLIFSPQSSCLDLGCGSGILAMAFAKATKGRAIAVDLDPQSVKIAKQNVSLHKLDKQIRAAKSDGYQSALVKKNAPYDLIMANIFADPLCKMAKDLKRHLRPGGTAILSGILNKQANVVLKAHEKQGLKLIRRLKQGEWAVLMLKKSIKVNASEKKT